jgi:hypothetical protein
VAQGLEGSRFSALPRYLPAFVLARVQPEIVKARRLPETTQRDISPMDSVRCKCINPDTLIESSGVETFSGAACLPRGPAALDF